jgi:tricarballylate dehydrogenase
MAMSAADKSYDVIVVGAGNAALCSALSAREQGARVLVLERAPRDQRGGNSSFAGGGLRVVHSGTEDVKKIIPDLTAEEIATTDFGVYTREQYLDDLARVTQFHADPDLAEILVDSSTDTVHWIRGQGIRFVPYYGRHSFKHEGRFKFVDGVVIAAVGGGRGLVDAEFKVAEKAGIEIRYGAHVTALLRANGGVEGVRAITAGKQEELRARAVVLACGGFEANREWRARYLGAGWDLAKVRGTRYNTGDGLRMALDIGAQPHGQWSGCHSVPWERYAADFGYVDAHMTHTSGQRYSYPFSIMVNANGERFLDEGADFLTYTYAKYGGVLLRQPGSHAWQIYDAQVTRLQRDEYRERDTTKVQADTLEKLAERMEGVDAAQFLATVREYNAAVRRDVPFNPTIKDGRGTTGLAINKSNWANPIEVPPFEAYPVGTGITFTFGGIKIDQRARVLDIADTPIPGLYAAGEMVGGLFYFNYLGDAGLVSGAVFGRIAGREARAFAN